MSPTDDRFPRVLTPTESSILRFLLSVEAPGVDALREQAAAVTAVAGCQCGCATIDLMVDKSAAPQSSIRHSPAIDAHMPSEGRPLEEYGLLLFLEDGWLSMLEIYYYGDEPPSEFPAPEEFDAPRLRPG